MGHDAIWEGLEEAQPINWLAKPEPESYEPFNPDNLFEGTAGYGPVVIGDDESTSFVIAHNLGTSNLGAVLVIENSGSKRVMGENLEYQVEITDDNSITLDFAVAPDVDGVAVTILTVEPVQQFVGDIEIEQAQVTGLEDRLDEIEARLDSIEEHLPGTGTPIIPGSTIDPVATQISLRDFFAVFPGRFADSFDPKTVAAEADPTPLEDERPVALLPACHDSSVANASTIIG